MDRSKTRRTHSVRESRRLGEATRVSPSPGVVGSGNFFFRVPAVAQAREVKVLRGRHAAILKLRTRMARPPG